MVSTLADRRHVSESSIQDTMTPEQIQLRYFFYIREKHREAKLQANALAEVLVPIIAGKAVLP